jgi:uncharacterized protein YjbJ (UPF0337 family)
MSSNNDIILGKWHELKGQVRQRWGKLTEDDVARLSGKTEELAGVLRQRIGYAKAQAHTAFDNRVHKQDLHSKK